MKPEQFAYWLQGFVELNGGKLPTAAQWKSIKEHLAEVFTKVTPPVEELAKESLPARMKVDSKKLEEILKELGASPSSVDIYCSHSQRIC